MNDGDALPDPRSGQGTCRPHWADDAGPGALPRPPRAPVEALTAEVMRVQDALASRTPDALMPEILALREMADRCERLPAAPDIPGLRAYSPSSPRLHPGERGLVPPLTVARLEPHHMSGTLTFGPHHSGATTVHGGAVDRGHLAHHPRALRRDRRIHRLDVRDILTEVGHRKLVGGQEDMIVDIALDLTRIVAPT